MFEKESQDYAMKEVAPRQELYIKGRADIDTDYEKVKKIWQDGAEFGYNECKDKLDTAIEIIEQMKDLFFDCWQERGYEAIKFEQKVNDFLKENK